MRKVCGVFLVWCGLSLWVCGAWGAPRPDFAFTAKKESTSFTDHRFRAVRTKVKKGSNLYLSLRQLGLPGPATRSILKAVSPYLKLSRVPPGTAVRVSWSKEDPFVPYHVKIQLSERRSVFVKRVGKDWVARSRALPVTRKLVGFTGVVKNTFWGSANKIGMDPELILRLAEIFSSLVDFNRETQDYDRWRLVVEREFIHDKPLNWGKILAAEFENRGVVHTAVYFSHPDVRRHYFSPSGSSLERRFLKSPLKFGRVTSRFNRYRFHPILKVVRPHLGVDYGAPTGTPVMSVGTGVVTFVGWNGGGGKTVKIRHSRKYQTAYKHLSRFAVSKGQKVQMGQKIGYVGKTGRATGPHLHFEFYENGRYVDPLSLEFPSIEPLPKHLLPELRLAIQKYFNQMPPWQELQS